MSACLTIFDTANACTRASVRSLPSAASESFLQRWVKHSITYNSYMMRFEYPITMQGILICADKEHGFIKSVHDGGSHSCLQTQISSERIRWSACRASCPAQRPSRCHGTAWCKDLLWYHPRAQRSQTPSQLRSWCSWRAVSSSCLTCRTCSPSH